MKYLIITTLFLLSCSNCFSQNLSISRTRSIDEVDRSKFYAYKERMDVRRDRALELRRAYNSEKVHTYWTAMVYPRYYPRYYPYNYERLPVRRVERSEYRYDYKYDYGY